MTLPAFADAQDLESRLPGGIRDADAPRAQAALGFASMLIRAEAGVAWVTDDELDYTKGSSGLGADLKQSMLEQVCLAAALRSLQNPEVFDDQTGVSTPTNVYLTRAERKIVRKAAGVGGLGTITTTRSVDGEYDTIDVVAADNPSVVIADFPWTFDPLPPG